MEDIMNKEIRKMGMFLESIEQTKDIDEEKKSTTKADVYQIFGKLKSFLQNPESINFFTSDEVKYVHFKLMYKHVKENDVKNILQHIQETSNIKFDNIHINTSGFHTEVEFYMRKGIY
jgi:hypothetical protein